MEQHDSLPAPSPAEGYAQLPQTTVSPDWVPPLTLQRNHRRACAGNFDLGLAFAVNYRYVALAGEVSSADYRFLAVRPNSEVTSTPTIATRRAAVLCIEDCGSSV